MNPANGASLFLILLAVLVAMLWLITPFILLSMRAYLREAAEQQQATAEYLAGIAQALAQLREDAEGARRRSAIAAKAAQAQDVPD